MSKENLIQFPKFYIKAVGGKFSLEHRLTHTYLETYDTEAELVAGVKKWNALSDEELWKVLLYEKHARVPKTTIDFSKHYSHEEDWYSGAWGIYTSQFFKKYRKLLVEVAELPYDLINRIRREKNERENEAHKRMLAERDEATKRLDAEEKENSRKKPTKPEEDFSVPIGDGEKAEKVATKKKIRTKAKLKVKRKKGTSLKVPIVNDNPFD